MIRGQLYTYCITEFLILNREDFAVFMYMYPNYLDTLTSCHALPVIRSSPFYLLYV